jgi:hypothetical protein
MTAVGQLIGPDRAAPLPDLEDDRAYYLECTDEENRIVYGQPVVWDPAEPLGPVVADVRAAEAALEALPIADPTIRTSPAADQLVGVEAWLWLDDPWTAQTATAAISSASATVNAEPVEVVWDPGDGSEPVVCDGPGTPFGGAAASDCTHVWQRRSTVTSTGGDDPDGTFTLTATVTYEVTYTTTTGETGTLDPVTRTASIPVRVQELQAVITRQ